MTPARRDTSPGTAAARDVSRRDRRATDGHELATLLRHRLIIVTLPHLRALGEHRDRCQ